MAVDDRDQRVVVGLADEEGDLDRARRRRRRAEATPGRSPAGSVTSSTRSGVRARTTSTAVTSVAASRHEEQRRAERDAAVHVSARSSPAITTTSASAREVAQLAVELGSTPSTPRSAATFCAARLLAVRVHDHRLLEPGRRVGDRADLVAARLDVGADLAREPVDRGAVEDGDLDVGRDRSRPTCGAAVGCRRRRAAAARRRSRRRRAAAPRSRSRPAPAAGSTRSTKRRQRGCGCSAARSIVIRSSAGRSWVTRVAAGIPLSRGRAAARARRSPVAPE